MKSDGLATAQLSTTEFLGKSDIDRKGVFRKGNPDNTLLFF